MDAPVHAGVEDAGLFVRIDCLCLFGRDVCRFVALSPPFEAPETLAGGGTDGHPDRERVPADRGHGPAAGNWVNAMSAEPKLKHYKSHVCIWAHARSWKVGTHERVQLPRRDSSRHQS